MRKKDSTWRNAGRRLTIYGVPAMLFLIYLFWCKWPSMITLYICTGVIAFFAVIARYGWTITVLLQRLFHLLKGNKKAGRPWWYRRFYE